MSEKLNEQEVLIQNFIAILEKLGVLQGITNFCNGWGSLLSNPMYPKVVERFWRAFESLGYVGANITSILQQNAETMKMTAIAQERTSRFLESFLEKSPIEKSSIVKETKLFYDKEIDQGVKKAIDNLTSYLSNIITVRNKDTAPTTEPKPSQAEESEPTKEEVQTQPTTIKVENIESIEKKEDII